MALIGARQADEQEDRMPDYEAVAKTLNKDLNKNIYNALSKGQWAAFVLYPLEDEDTKKLHWVMCVRSKKVVKNDAEKEAQQALGKQFTLSQYVTGRIMLKYEIEGEEKATKTQQLFWVVIEKVWGGLDQQPLKAQNFVKDVLLELLRFKYAVSPKLQLVDEKGRAVKKEHNITAKSQITYSLLPGAKAVAMNELKLRNAKLKAKEQAKADAKAAGLEDTASIDELNAMVQALAFAFVELRSKLRRTGDEELIELANILQGQIDENVSPVGKALKAKDANEIKQAQRQFRTYLRSEEGQALDDLIDLTALGRKLEALVKGL